MMDFYTGAWSDIEQTYGGRSGIDWQDKIFLVEVLLLKAIIYLFLPERKKLKYW